MAVRDALLAEFDNEMANTRKVLERVPEDKLDWRPHPKSGTMAWMAGHVANLSQWATMTLQTTELDIGGENAKPGTPPGSRRELLEQFETRMKEARAAIAAASDEEFVKPWSLLKDGQKLFTMPKIGVLRGFVMNHMIHHRGQLTVYLRLTGAPVPALYGPSADEQPF